MGNILLIVFIGLCIGLSLYVIFKLIKVGIDDRNLYDKQQDFNKTNKNDLA